MFGTNEAAFGVYGDAYVDVFLVSDLAGIQIHRRVGLKDAAWSAIATALIMNGIVVRPIPISL